MKALSRGRVTLGFRTVCLLAFLGLPALCPVAAQTGQANTGGPHGLVRSATGAPLEGIMVQLISGKSSIRTTVYSDEDGHYEFPLLPDGSYTLRVARPLEFEPYVRSSLRIDGAMKLEDIVLQRRSESAFLAPAADILPQLTDSEWLWNLPGTAEEKQAVSYTCGSGCHTLQRIFRARYDERSWRLIVDRMVHYKTRLLQHRLTVPPGMGDGALQSEADFETIVEWLAKVRGPGAADPPFQVYRRPTGPATHVVVTEYELPTIDERPSYLAGDSDGNIWYAANRRPVIGKLDPKTGVVTEYQIPTEPGQVPGAQWIASRNTLIWYTDAWAENLYRFDPRSNTFHKMPGWGGVMSMSSDGFLWRAQEQMIQKIDPETGQSVAQFPMKITHTVPAVESDVSPDGRFFVGGVPYQKSFDGFLFLDTKTGEVREVRTPSGAAHPSSGSFDPDDNAWIGGKGGVLIGFNTRTQRVSEYVPPTPFVNIYDAAADRNGDIWMGLMHAGRVARFKPRTQQWIEYQMPEPYSLAWKVWIDNSTNPVTVWYGDYNGFIVRLQPRD